jgi:nucleoside-diphosphate-sugar epimerase
MGLQVIFGTGPVGLDTAQALLNQGMRVRLINRSGILSEDRRLVVSSLNNNNGEILKVDARNPDEVQRAAEGASHIYHCVNPLYHQWADILPLVQENLINAALAEDAVLAASENLYMYKRGVEVIGLDTPIEPPTRKGMIRQGLHQKLVRAGLEKGLRWTTVRGSDFFGPGSTDQSTFGTKYFLDPLFRGQKIALMGNPEMAHSYTYVKDFGKTLAMAAHNEKAWGKPWILANQEVTSTGEIVRLFMDRSGRSAPVGRLSRKLLKFLGLFSPVIREVPEMLYQKEEDYVVDGAHLQKVLEFTPTPLIQAVEETLKWYEDFREVSGAVTS